MKTIDKCLYGAGPSKIAETANVSVKEAKEFIEKYFREANALKRWIDSCLSMINHQYFIYSAFGRKRRLPEAKADNRAAATHASRSGLNFLVQSVASDVNLLGLIDLIEWIQSNNLEDKVRVFATVHDSIVAEVADDVLDEYVRVIRSSLQKDRGVNIANCPIVVDVEVGPSWGELKTYEEPK